MTEPNTESSKKGVLSTIQLSILVLLRLAIGWLFLYEGIVKLFKANWTSYGFLDLSRWIFSDFFQWIASDPTVLKVVDMANTWGLILIGLGLILGCLTRLASIGGLLLLALYYIAQPPLVGFDFGAFREGNYLVVDKNLVVFCGLLVVAIFPSGTFLGLDCLLAWLKQRRAKPEPAVAADPSAEFQLAPAQVSLGRRELLKSVATVPVLGAFVLAILKKRGWESYEEKNLKDNKSNKVDAVTSATIKTFNFSSLKDLKGKIPHARIGNKEFSRLILGGNLIGGWAHARDLIYVSKLVKAYHSDYKVFETLYVAEKCGINAILTNPILCRVINEYWRRDIGKIQFISDCGGQDLLDRVRMSIDNGASACYVQGETADRLVKEGKIDVIAEALDITRKSNMPAGIGGHRLETIKACAEKGLRPDFWMKTFHHKNYWSAKPTEEHDNIYCREPEETAEFMKTQSQAWIAFKTLAAGAIQPEDGFRYAFENGADFVCVGMYDFQIVDDVNIALAILSSDLKRERPWQAPTVNGNIG